MEGVPVVHAWKACSDSASYSEQAVHLVKTFSSFLPSSLRPSAPAAPDELSDGSFFRVAPVRGGPVRVVVCGSARGGGAAAFEVGSRGARLLVHAPLAGKLVPLWGPSGEEEDGLEAHRPLFAGMEGEGSVAVRGEVGKAVLVLRSKSAVDAMATCPRGLLLLSGGRVTLYDARNLAPARWWQAGPAAVLAAGARLLAMSCPRDAEPAAGPSEEEGAGGMVENGIEDAARATLDWVAPMGPRQTGQGCMVVVDMESGEEVAAWQAHRHALTLACWDDSGAALYSVSDGRTVGVWEIKGRSVRCAARLRRGYAGSRLLGLDARSGGMIAAASARGTHHVWRAGEVTAVARIRRGDGTLEGLAASGWGLAALPVLYTLEGNGLLVEWRLSPADGGCTSVRETRLERPAGAVAYACSRELPPPRVPRNDWHARIEIRTSDGLRAKKLRGSEQFTFVVGQHAQPPHRVAVRERPKSEERPKQPIAAAAAAVEAAKKDEGKPVEKPVVVAAAKPEPVVVAAKHEPVVVAAKHEPVVVPVVVAAVASPSKVAVPAVEKKVESPPKAAPQPELRKSAVGLAPVGAAPIAAAVVAANKVTEEKKKEERKAEPEKPPTVVLTAPRASPPSVVRNPILPPVSNSPSPTPTSDERSIFDASFSKDELKGKGSKKSDKGKEESLFRSDDLMFRAFHSTTDSDNSRSQTNSSPDEDGQRHDHRLAEESPRWMEDYDSTLSSGAGHGSGTLLGLPQRKASLNEVGMLGSSPEAPTHAAPLPAVPLAHTRMCGVCSEYKTRESFSNTQWRKAGGHIRCKQCSGSNAL